MLTQREREETLQTDRERVQLVLQGDQDAFSDLVTTYQRSVYNLAYRMLGDRTEAEDATQEAFIRAYHNLKSYDPARLFKTWLLSITSHYCIDLIRKRRMSLLSLEDLLPGQMMAAIDHWSVEDHLVEHESVAAIQRMLAQLRPDDRAIIILRYWNDMSYEDIAETLGATVSIVKSRLFRARQALANRVRVHEAGLQYAAV